MNRDDRRMLQNKILPLLKIQFSEIYIDEEDGHIHAYDDDLGHEFSIELVEI